MTSMYSNDHPAHVGYGGSGDLHHTCAADKPAATVRCYHVNMVQNL